MRLIDLVALFIVAVVAYWFAMETFPHFRAWRDRIGSQPQLPDESCGPVIDVETTEA